MIQNRLNWYNMKCGLSIESIVKRLNNAPYNDEKNIGFDVLEIQPKKFVSRYIERQYIIEELQNPFGDIEKTTSIRYIIFQFEIIFLKKNNYLIKVINPPLSLKSFVRALSGLFLDDLFICKIQINVEDCYTAILQFNEIKRYTVGNLIASRIPFSKKTVASISLKSTGNAYDEFKKKYEDKSYNLDNIKMTVRVLNETESIEISSSGRIRCTLGIEKFVDKYIENKLLTEAA